MASPLTYDYDEESDILYLFRGKPYDTSNIELDEHLVLRMDPASHQVVGMMIHNLSSHLEGPINQQTLPTIAQALQFQIDTLNSLRTHPDIRELLLAG